MPKFEHNPVSNPENQTSFVSQINTNLENLETFSDTVLSRDGTSPNSMEADLDMNSHRVLNLPEAVDDTEPLRKIEFDTLYEELQELKGIPGPQGEQGPQGEPGEQGPPGDPWSQWQGAWNSSTNYVINDAVSHEGSSYIAVADNTNSEPPSADWDVLAEAGQDGQDGEGAGNVNTGSPPVVSGNLVQYTDTDGNVIDDSGIAVSDVVVDSDIADMVESTDVTTIVVLADQAAYDALDPPDANTLYLIPDA